MLKQIIHQVLLRRHFWRYASFSEVAEIYTSRTLRLVAINLASVLISVFLYQNGYNVLFIAGYWTLYFFLKAFMSLPATMYVGRYGAKHATLLSNLLYIPAMISFTFVPQYGLLALAATCLLQGASATIYDISYLVNFSKVKSLVQAGRQIAFMNTFEKIATGLSPLVGGLLAFTFGPIVTLWVASALFAVASVPLMLSPEPMRMQRKLVIRRFPWRLARRSLIAEVAVGYDVVASGTMWSLLVAVAILGVHGDDVYAKLGALLTAVMVVGLIMPYVYGSLIDKRRGGALLKFSVVAKSLTHIAKPFTDTIGGVVAVNATSDMASTGYAMAFMRGLFDTADLSGKRVIYMGFVNMSANIGASLSGLTMVIAVWAVGNEVSGMRAYFFVVAAVCLIVATANFRLYRK